MRLVKPVFTDTESPDQLLADLDPFSVTYRRDMALSDESRAKF